MDNKPTVFGKNLAAIMTRLGIPTELLSKTEVQHRGQSAKVSRKALGDILAHGANPRIGTKAIIVKAIKSLHPELSAAFSVEALELKSFTPEDYLPKDAVPSHGDLNVDWLKDTIKSISERSQSRDQLITSLVCIPIENAKIQFWKKIRELTKALGITDKAFNEALQHGGMAPELPLPPGGDSLKYAQRICANPASLSRNHRIIWKVVSAAYPPHSSDTDQEFKAAARYLAWYWNHSIAWMRETWGISIVQELGQRKPYEKALVILLSWLELPLVLQTGNVGPGKSRLFELGRWYQDKSGLP